MSDKEGFMLDGEDDANLGFIISDVVSLADTGRVEENSDGKTLEKETLAKQTLHRGQDIPLIDLEDDSQTFVGKTEPSLLTTFNKSPPVLSIKDSGDCERKYVVPTPTSSSPGEDKSLTSLLPDIHQCLSNWRTIFPWVRFNERKKLFFCGICMWGYNYPGYYEVFQLISQSDKPIVAGKFRLHSKKKYHDVAAKEQDVIVRLCECIYATVKDDFSKLQSLDCLQRKMSPILLQGVPESKSFISIALQNLALVIEQIHLESLLKSRYFSIVAFGYCDFLLLRWTTDDNEVVEHMFCNHVQKYKKKLPIMAYLQYKGLNMKNMVSYSDLLNNPKEFIKSAATVVNVANRLCSVDSLIDWLKHVEGMNEVILHLKTIFRLLRVSETPDLKEQFKEFANFSEEDPAKVLKVEGILNIVFANALNLNIGAIFKLGSPEGVDFKKLATKRRLALLQILDLLPVLNTILEDVDAPDCREQLGKFKVIMEGIHTKDYFLKHIIDVFCSLALLTKDSQAANDFPHIDTLLISMDKLTCDDLETVFKVFMRDFSPVEGLKQFVELQGHFAAPKFVSPLYLLAQLQDFNELHKQYPKLLELGHKIMVVPILSAHVERNYFDVSVAKACVDGKVPKELAPLLVYLYLEGPDTFSGLSKESILELFK